MRKIQFRGKCIDSKYDWGERQDFWIDEWVYGGYAQGKYTYITEGTIRIKVNPDTVGQYTGLCDIEDKDVYEGDILQNIYHEENIYIVKYVNGSFYGIYDKSEIIYDEEINMELLSELLANAPCKIIGNIWDNVDLIHHSD